MRISWPRLTIALEIAETSQSIGIKYRYILMKDFLAKFYWQKFDRESGLRGCPLVGTSRLGLVCQEVPQRCFNEHKASDEKSVT
jgi:hypothetical protein